MAGTVTVELPDEATVEQPLDDHMREMHGEREPQSFTAAQLAQAHAGKHRSQNWDHSHPSESGGVLDSPF
jgi:hypothetical protein